MNSKITFGNTVKMHGSVKGFVNNRMGEDKQKAFYSAVTAFESSRGDTFVRMSTPKRDKGIVTLEVSGNGVKAKYNLPKYFLTLSTPEAISNKIKSCFKLS